MMLCSTDWNMWTITKRENNQWYLEGIKTILVEGLRSSSWHWQDSHGDVKYSIGHLVKNTVITVVPVGTGLTGTDHLVSYMNVSPLCSTPETNIIQGGQK